VTRLGGALARGLTLTLALMCGACVRPEEGPPPGVLVVSVEKQSAWVRNFNPLMPGGGARWPTAGGVYEPLLVFNSVRGEYVPWLATRYDWLPGAEGVVFTLRAGVRWSDGAPLTADDVAFTFELLKRSPALDAGGVWRYLERVDVERGPEGERVVMRLKTPHVPALHGMAHTPIVPRHVFEAVADPVTFTNPDPVGSGPFTQVRVFRNQVFELGRNPHYWGGPPAVEALRMPAYPTNDAASLALIFGEVDWAGDFVPAVERTFVARDPEHFGVWAPPVGSLVFLYPNTTRAPFDDVRIRRAISLAIDRARVVEVGMYGYTTPANAVAFSERYARWQDKSLDGSPEDAVRFDPEAAERLLDEAGWPRGPDGLRRGPDGTPLSAPIDVVSGWSDWVRSGQVIARNLRAVGVDTQLRTLDFSAWFERVQKGEFDLAIGWSDEGATPYDFYCGLFNPETVKPVGALAPTNWHRFGDAESAPLFDAFKRATEPAEQRRLVDALQRRFVHALPAIPLFPNPSWGTYSTRRFTGFPTADDPYARLSPFAQPEALLVMTRLRPVDAPEGEVPR